MLASQLAANRNRRRGEGRKEEETGKKTEYITGCLVILAA